MKSSDLVLFRDICDGIDHNLYNILQTPDEDFKNEVENGNYFKLLQNALEYDFEDIEDKCDIKLRYYQRLALYFTKYYFERKYLIKGNENNKLTYWMATGSGKTVIMKANIIDYFEYLKSKNPTEVEVIITSPLKELIGQLQNEMSDFFATSFFKDFKFSYKIETTQSLIENYKNESHEILGENHFRLLLVDEAHIGLGTDKKGSGAFVNIRNELTQKFANSFMFEYSATFYDVTSNEQVKEYAEKIVYEYDYGKFYNDKYGKDFKFDVVKKDEIAQDEDKDIKRNLDANLKAFSEKLQSFDAFNTKYRTQPFPNRPLLIMAGNTVSASSEKQANNEENSDIAKIIGYFATLGEKEDYQNIFHQTNGTLHLLQNSSSDGEVLLSFGEDISPFGLITVGDVKKFLENSNIQKLISEDKIISKTLKFSNENYLFKNIDFESSPINILIGSRKFSAGWNSFRASQICLINFGTGSGPTIIQMFGRGVRLKGLNNDGKRQEHYYVNEKDETKSEFLSWDKSNLSSKHNYELLKYLETLFIYSLRSTYLKKFVEEDTDIYKKNITLTKAVEVGIEHEGKSLPIFYVDKSFQAVENNIECSLYITNNELLIDYKIDGISKNTKINLPLVFNLSLEKQQTLEFDSFKWLLDFIDKSYLEKLIEKKLQQNHILIDNFGVNYALVLLENKNIKIEYDGELNSPNGIHKLLLKIAYTLISKVKNKIFYNENKQSYKFTQTVSSDDYISKYDIKFILDQGSDPQKIRERLDKDQSYKIFIDKVTEHYYNPLVIDPVANAQQTYETFQKCIDNNFTENMKNIIEFDEKYFENIESIKISPDKLDPYELKFVCDIQSYIISNSLEATILRNKSNGNIGLISDDGVFYPDFIVWYKDDTNQEHIIFCDPKGIRNPETKWKVCDAPYAIKDIEKQWNNNIKLHSFVISNTYLNDIAWEPVKILDIEACDKFYNLMFFDDVNYIKRIFNGLNTDMALHAIFQRYIKHFDKETINEWLDDAKRESHLKIINTIVMNESITQEQAILLYFFVWNKKDKIVEKTKNEVKDDVKEHAINEILSEVLSEVVLDSIPFVRTGLKIMSYITKSNK
ncbi:MAG: DEAD/DEAH box helicase family protein [Sulfuricurvum sp.]|uniref:DEAD/DEAH box helicase family protein n=1 Tax=Sulfuricurvum sp. TaxID=2025608 RepID=UPI0026213231|nr:DEAD/DEAH box helicase family protein [Sulfuricurvum sp.]MDD5160035.1 DEAD/DEAH box helicase family protein [Sulfuricurvum sp.]